MAVYTYTAYPDHSQTASPIHGTIHADSPRQARDQLRSRNLRLRDLVETRPRSTGNHLQRYLARRQAARVTEFLQELSTLLSAGIPLLESLDTIASQQHGSFQQSIMMIRDHIAAGGDLAGAMELQPYLYDSLCQNIVSVGENSGALDASLHHLVDFRRHAATLKNKLASALTYPVIVLCVGVAVSIFLMTYVLPNLLAILADSGKALPFATLTVKTISDTLIQGWWFIAAAGLALILIISAFLRSERGSNAWHRLQLRIPIIGSLIRKQAIARMAMVMAVLLKSDLPFIRALQIAQRTMRNRIIRQALNDCEKAVFAGRDISIALQATAIFPPLVIQVFAVGQASGHLETMLDDLASDYNVQVDIASTRFAALLEPLMMISLAVVVGFIAFAAILPILEAGDVL